MNSVKNEAKRIYDTMYDAEFKSQIIRFLKARVPLVNINSTDERKAKCFFNHFSMVKGYNLYIWDCVTGLRDVSDHSCCVEAEEHKDIHAVLAFILKTSSDTQNIERFKKEGKRGLIYILSDIEYYLDDPIVVRYLKMIYNGPTISSLFFITPETNIPKDSSLKNKISIITPPASSTAEYEGIFDGMLVSLGNKSHKNVRDKLIKDKKSILGSLKGMDLEEASTVLAVKVITYHDFLKNNK